MLDLDPMHYLGELARPGSRLRFLKSIHEVARLEHKSPLALLGQINRMAKINLPEALYNLSRALIDTQNPDLQQANNRWFPVAGAAPEWLTSQARRELSELALARGDEVKVPEGLGAGNYAALSAIRSAGPFYRGAMQFARRYGIREHNPFLDNGVLRAGFSIAASERVDPWVLKGLLRQALSGHVPDIVLQRDTKSSISKHLYQSLWNTKPVFEHLLQDSRLADLGIIEPHAVQESLERAYMGGPMAFPAFFNFLAAELWLRKLDGALTPNFPNRKSARSYKAPAPKTGEEPVELLLGTAQYGVSPHLVIARRQSGASTLNKQTGEYVPLNQDALVLVEALSSTANFDEAIEELARIYQGVSKARLQAIESESIRQLVDLGVLQEGKTPLFLIEHHEAGYSGAADGITVRPPRENISLTIKERLAVMGGFVAMLAFKRQPFPRQLDILTHIHQRWPKTATLERAERLHIAAERMSDFTFDRMACLETTLTTVWAAALMGDKVDWVIGNRTYPDKFHTWPEVDEVVVQTARDWQMSGVCQALLKV